MYSRKHYLKVLAEASDALDGVDVRERAEACGFTCVKSAKGKLELHLVSFGREYRIDTEKWGITAIDNGRVMPLQMRIIALHLLAQSRKTSLTGELQPLKAFSGLEMYAQVIRRRSNELLIRVFGERPELMPPAIEKLGGEILDRGDAAGRLSPFPLLPIEITVYEAEPGLPAESNVAFDSCADRLIHVEDLVVAAELTSHKLINAALEIARNK